MGGQNIALELSKVLTTNVQQIFRHKKRRRAREGGKVAEGGGDLKDVGALAVRTLLHHLVLALKVSNCY